MELSQITDKNVPSLSFREHEDLLKKFIARMENYPEEAVLSITTFCNLLKGKGLDSDLRPLAVKAFAKMSKGLSSAQINAVVDKLYAEEKTILIEKGGYQICRENPHTAVVVFERLFSGLKQTAANKTRATTVLDNSRIEQIADIIACADEQDSLWMMQCLYDSYPSIPNMMFSRLGKLYQKQPILRSMIWEKINQYNGGDLKSFYANIFDIVSADDTKASGSLQLISKSIEQNKLDELKKAYSALGAIRKVYDDKNKVDNIFEQALQNPNNDEISRKIAYRNMEQKDKLRSHAELGERVDKTEDNNYGFKRVDSINPDETAILFLGGSGADSDRSANSYLSSVDELIREHNIKQKVKLYAAIYDFGDELDRDAYCNASLARIKLLEQYRHRIPLDAKFSKPSDDTINPRYITELFNNTLLHRISDEEGHRLSLTDACRKIRKMTIIAHCHGAYTFIKLEEMMQNKMQELGYSKEEMAQIQHELLCVAHAPFAPLGVSKSTMISFASADDDQLNHYNSFNYQVRSMPDRNLLFSYFPKERGELVLVPSLGHKVEQHNFVGYNVNQSDLNKEGRVFVGLSANAVLNGIKSSLNDERLPSIKDLICGHDKQCEKILDRLEQNGSKMWNRIKERAIKQRKKQVAIRQKNSRFLGSKER